MLPEPSDDLLGGRIPLRKLIDAEELPYKDHRYAIAYLDRLGVPYVFANRQRPYRRIDIVRAINRSEERTPAAA